MNAEGILSGGDWRFAVPPTPDTVRIRVRFTDCGGWDCWCWECHISAPREFSRRNPPTLGVGVTQRGSSQRPELLYICFQQSTPRPVLWDSGGHRVGSIIAWFLRAVKAPSEPEDEGDLLCSDFFLNSFVTRLTLLGRNLSLALRCGFRRRCRSHSAPAGILFVVYNLESKRYESTPSNHCSAANCKLWFRLVHDFWCSNNGCKILIFLYLERCNSIVYHFTMYW